MDRAAVITIIATLLVAALAVAIGMQSDKKQVEVASAVIALASFAAALYVGMRQLEGDDVRPQAPDQPAVTSAPSARHSLSGQSGDQKTTHSPKTLPTAVVINLDSACRWAYGSRAGGAINSTPDDPNSLQCLDKGGNAIGGFEDGSGRSLNDWCSDPARTGNNPNLRQAEVVSTSSADRWQCVPVK